MRLRFIKLPYVSKRKRTTSQLLVNFVVLVATSWRFRLSIHSDRSEREREKKACNGLICMSLVVRPYTPTRRRRQPAGLRRRSGFNILLACEGPRHFVGNTAAGHSQCVPPRSEYQSCLEMPPHIARGLEIIFNTIAIDRCKMTALHLSLILITSNSLLSVNSINIKIRVQTNTESVQCLSKK